MSRSTQRVVFMIVCFIAAWMQGLSAHATSVSDVLPKPYKYQPRGFQTCQLNPLVKGACVTAGKMEHLTILHQTGDESCPAGYYYLLDDKEKVADTLPTNECDPSVVLDFVKNPTTREIFIVMSLRGQPVERFTLQ